MRKILLPFLFAMVVLGATLTLVHTRLSAIEAAAAESVIDMDTKLHCVRIGKVTYFHFTQQLGGKQEVFLPVNLVTIGQASDPVEDLIYLWGGRHNRNEAKLGDDYRGMTKIEVIRHCMENATPYTGS